MTEIVTGRNPDGRTQYRLNIGEPDQILTVEEDLLILTDGEGLVLMHKQKVEYRCHIIIIDQLHSAFANDRFIASHWVERVRHNRSNGKRRSAPWFGDDRSNTSARNRNRRSNRSAWG